MLLHINNADFETVRYGPFFYPPGSTLNDGSLDSSLVVKKQAKINNSSTRARKKFTTYTHTSRHRNTLPIMRMTSDVTANRQTMTVGAASCAKRHSGEQIPANSKDCVNLFYSLLSLQPPPDALDDDADVG